MRINFLLERLLTERGGLGKKDLFETARELLELTVFLWLERERWTSRQHDYDYLVIIFLLNGPVDWIALTDLLDLMLWNAIDWRFVHRTFATS